MGNVVYNNTLTQCCVQTRTWRAASCRGDRGECYSEVEGGVGGRGRGGGGRQPFVKKKPENVAKHEELQADTRAKLILPLNLLLTSGMTHEFIIQPLVLEEHSRNNYWHVRHTEIYLLFLKNTVCQEKLVGLAPMTKSTWRPVPGNLDSSVSLGHGRSSKH